MRLMTTARMAKEFYYFNVFFMVTFFIAVMTIGALSLPHLLWSQTNIKTSINMAARILPKLPIPSMTTRQFLPVRYPSATNIPTQMTQRAALNVKNRI